MKTSRITFIFLTALVAAGLSTVSTDASQKEVKREVKAKHAESESWNFDLGEWLEGLTEGFSESFSGPKRTAAPFKWTGKIAAGKTFEVRGINGPIRAVASRGSEVLVQLLGAVFAGILCSDRCPSYGKYHKGSAQYCWAHFKRNILGAQELAKTTGTEKFCRDALALHARLFRLWHRFGAGPDVRYGPVTREQLILKSIPIQRKFLALGKHYLDSPDKDARNLGTALFKNYERFFTFIDHEGVEPTNNSAERALRCAVQWRKTSFGSRSPQGEVAMARLLTVARTCRMQNRNALHYFAHAIRSHRSDQPCDSLLQNDQPT